MPKHAKLRNFTEMICETQIGVEGVEGGAGQNRAAQHGVGRSRVVRGRMVWTRAGQPGVAERGGTGQSIDKRGRVERGRIALSKAAWGGAGCPKMCLPFTEAVLQLGHWYSIHPI